MNKDTLEIRKSTEEFVWDMLEQEHGKLRVKVSHELRHEKLCAVIEGMAQAHINFTDNPSAVNWNLCITAMITYQYWKQKKVE